MGQVKFISDKVSFSVSHKELKVVILGKVERWKETLLLMWLIAWTFCGIAMAAALFNEGYSQDLKIGIAVFLTFWVYYEYRIGRVFLFRKYGNELILIKEGRLYLKRSILTYGKAREYLIDNIRNFKKVEIPKRSISNAYENSFWILGGERLSFQYLDKYASFGVQLNPHETEALYKLLRANFKAQKKE